jgi:hypothetical protein
MKRNKTLARKSILQHQNGASIATPLLIPSFSSKGFSFDSKGNSDLNRIYKTVSEYITQIMLISAYDIYYKNIKKPNYKISDITVIDSGGYEISDFNDLSTILTTNNTKKEWTEEKLMEVYNKIPNYYSAILVNYDHPDKRTTTKRQIEKALSFFKNFPNHLHTLLIKPESKKHPFVMVKSVLSNIKRLAGFDIIGFTEKELGGSILERMIAIANIRIALDDIGLYTPLHIYGSLDPITSILYYIAGAEIFDGLTWLRYGFLDGNACYYNNFGTRVHGINIDDDRTKLYMIENNIAYLVKMKSQMEMFLLDGSFAIFGKNSKLSNIISDSYNLLRTKIARLK